MQRHTHFFLQLVVVVFMTSGCATLPTPAQRTQTANALAARAGWAPLYLTGGPFVLTAFGPAVRRIMPTLTVYIGGDGLAWLTPSTPSANPTPLNPVALKLALRDPAGDAVYLARPCQYTTQANWGACSVQYWTSRRFGPAVITATNRAINHLKQRFHATRIRLVGYSGGGAVAALVAARRHDVIRLITVAGNLDIRAWTNYHGVPPLSGSLNPADYWQQLINIPQKLFVGSRDRDVPPLMARDYASRFPATRKPHLVIVPQFDHACCWVKHWPDLLLGKYPPRHVARNENPTPRDGS